MSLNVTGSGIRGALNQGLGQMDKAASDLASAISKTDPMNQVEMIKLQQKMNMYTNSSSMYSTLFKSISDTEKNVIHNM